VFVVERTEAVAEDKDKVAEGVAAGTVAGTVVELGEDSAADLAETTVVATA
jgi:hypothetical protein